MAVNFGGINQAITQFVWNKKANIKYRTMVGPKEQGGLDIPDFQIIDEALKSACR